MKARDAEHGLYKKDQKKRGKQPASDRHTHNNK